MGRKDEARTPDADTFRSGGAFTPGRIAMTALAILTLAFVFENTRDVKIRPVAPEATAGADSDSDSGSGSGSGFGSDSGFGSGSGEEVERRRVPDFLGLGLWRVFTRLDRRTRLDVHDASGRDRQVLWPSRWRVCTQYPAAGADLGRGATVTIGVVRKGEDCPLRVRAARR